MVAGVQSAVPHRRKLDEIFREEQIQTPVERHPAFLFKSRKLAEIDRSPQPPRDKTRKVKSEDLCDAGTLADGRELT